MTLEEKLAAALAVLSPADLAFVQAMPEGDPEVVATAHGLGWPGSAREIEILARGSWIPTLPWAEAQDRQLLWAGRLADLEVGVRVKRRGAVG